MRQFFYQWKANQWKLMRKGLLPVVTLVLVGYAFLQAQSQSTVNEGDSFNYDFSIRDLKDRRLDGDELKGKVLFLNLWATWCGPCREEMPSIQALYNDASDSIEFVMLSIDRTNYYGKVKRFVSDQEFTFPVYMMSGPLTEQLNVPLIPTTIVVDKTGKIVFHHEGMKNYDTKKFREFLNGLAKQ